MRQNDYKPAFATVHAGYLQPGMTKREVVLNNTAQSLIATGKWKGIEEGFSDRVKAIAETILSLMDEKA
jgi:hypothetical protein